ncbi:unnamed protein product [Gordionus sp. m RMFG-2023]
MQGLWERQLNYIPLYIAPNVLTLLGLSCNVFTTLILMVYSPDAARDVPRWACALCALGLFIYQSLDALDGKQARRTSSSSPLGELFDHGCDAISAVFAVLSVCISAKLGVWPGPALFIALLTLFAFYTAHWHTYVSGRLLFTSLNVTEAQAGVAAVLLISALAGTPVWDTVPYLRLVIAVISGMGSAYIIYSYVTIVFSGGAGRNKSTVADTSVLSPAIPFAGAAVAALAIFDKSLALRRHLCLYILTFGLVIAKLTILLVLAHMTKSELSMMDRIFGGPALLALNQYYNHLFDERFVLWFAFIFTAFDITRYSICICLQISQTLKIPILTLPKNSSNAHQNPQTLASNHNLNNNAQAGAKKYK